jgi:hypothetical protein
MMPNEPSVKGYAFSCLDHGISVIPIKTDGSKSPAWGETRDFWRRLPQGGEMDEMFSRNVGLAVLCGNISRELEVLDFDLPGIFEEWLSILSPEAQALVAAMPCVATPKGGCHLYYRTMRCGASKKLAESTEGWIDLLGEEHTTLIELKGEGGYAVTYPSPHACHDAGAPYRHIAGPPVYEPPRITGEQRNELVDAARSFNETIELPKPDHRPGPGDRLGNDFNTRASWQSILEPHGWEKVKEARNNWYWRRPGKEKGTSATTGGTGDWLYVFSTNAAPLEPHRPYDKFGAYAVLNHDGDFRSATRALASEGYGKPRRVETVTPAPEVPEDPEAPDPEPPEAPTGDTSEPAPSRQPTIQTSPALQDMVDAGRAAIARDTTIFQRDGFLVHVTRTKEVKEKREKIAEGTPRLHLVETAHLRTRLANSAFWCKLDRRSGSLVHTIPPDNVVKGIEACKEWPTIRPLLGILEAPSLKPGGGLIQSPGYDEDTGYLYLPSDRYLDVVQEPTQDDANAALQALTEIWCDFPFAAESDRYVPIGAVLTLLSRPAIDGAVPGVIIDAHTPGTGKTLCTDAITMVAHGRAASRMNWPKCDEEVEKILGSYALNGSSLIVFDNIDKPFGGGPLDRVLTAEDKVDLRVLGKSEVPTVAWRALVMGTGNNVQLGSDTRRRVMVCKLETDLEQPETRVHSGFKHHPLKEWLYRNRPKLIRAALTVLRAYIAAGKPDVGVRPWGSFDEWVALVPSAILYAGGADITLTRPSVGSELDPETGAVRALLVGLEHMAPDGITAKNMVSSLYPREYLMGEVLPDEHVGLREAIETLVTTPPGRAPNAISLGKKLGRWSGRNVGGRKLSRVLNTQGITKWVVVRLTGDTGDNEPNSAVSDESGATTPREELEVLDLNI